MRILYNLSLGLLSLCVTSCVDKAYDMTDIQNMNTDINFGGAHFSVPIGSFEPILLGRFIQAGDLLKVSEGQYEFAYQDDQTTTIPTISPMDFTVNAVPVSGIPVDLSGVSINDIDLPDIKINQTAGSTLPSGQTGAVNPPIVVSMNDITSPIDIAYEYSDEIKQINHIFFGSTASPQGQLLALDLTPNYGNILTGASTNIDAFSVTFPYGFELSSDPNDPYNGTISVDKKTYSVTAQVLQPGKQMSFYVKKVTFNPAIDQTTKGLLHYQQSLTFSGAFSINGTATGVGGTVEVRVTENEQLTLLDGNFNTDIFTAQVPVQNTPIVVDEAINDPSILNVRKVTLTQPTAININIGVTGLPARIPGLALKEYQVHFPEFMVFADPTINASKSIILNDPIPNNGQLNKQVYIIGFDFETNPVQNGRLVVAGQATSSGGISLNPINNLNSSEIENIIIKPNVTLGAMQAGVLEAVIKPNVTINPIEIKVDLASNMDFLRQSVLDLDRIALQVQVENPTGIAAQIGVQLTPYNQENQPLSDNSIQQNSGMVMLPNKTSELWLSNSKTGMPEGYTFVENKNMARLFRTLPSRVETAMSVLANDMSSLIDLNNPQLDQLKIQYALVAPIAVGKDFQLVYKERVSGLRNQLSELLKYTRALELTIDAQNNIPLDLKVSASALDASGNAIPVTVGVQGVIAAGTGQGVTKSSTLVLSLKEEQANALNQLDQIELFFTGSTSPQETGAVLKEDQAIKLTMSAKVPGGFNLNLKQ